MARSESRTQTSIWRTDFVERTARAQRLYWLLYSQPTITLCGVLPYTPTRWASFASDDDEATIEAALSELEEHGFVLVDRATEEVLVRSFMRNDGVRPGNPKVWKPAMASYDGVLSPRLREALEREIERIEAEENEHARAHAHDEHPESTKAQVNGASNGAVNTQELSETDAAMPPARARTRPPTPTPAPSPTPARDTRTRADARAAFDRFWRAYPRRVERKRAEAAFAKAVRQVDPEAIIAGAGRYRDDPNRVPEFTKHPSTWLNGGCWDDEPLPPRSSGTANRNGAVIASVGAQVRRLLPPLDPPHRTPVELTGGNT